MRTDDARVAPQGPQKFPGDRRLLGPSAGRWLASRLV